MRALGEWQDAFGWLEQESSAVVNDPYDVQPIVGADVTIFGNRDRSRRGRRPRGLAGR